MHKREVGGRLRLAREALGLSQTEFAERYGYSEKTKISNWELGKNFPDPWFVKLMFEKDGISSDWVYLGKQWSLPVSIAQRIEQAVSKASSAEDSSRSAAEASEAE